ncbi:tRNA (adenosine(37)-N6)-threonylcarbamoyltransferase complex ATPase subunit type 1 TsaE [Cochlodiniinecator piscidefendens]|uniref:tRNA (adenosine(37)-N6)-threonylcarbamoyltransferase complex ATPase subunit type 1 TsaE n=1 Tax=Cochlodiniinecator piscidefendens TaxID=2715756 RepID=UPI00140B1F21|nr:tRNA (adenosine(37)-N6)-threonylcarbamoyltransferase complex ATPase subunit type 1 TsaE [Cochlodiniinecator piscidefendens]
MRTKTLILQSDTATTELAQQLAPTLGTGDAVLLEGPIGAGKTHFARALIQSLLDYAEDVPSPTFTLVQTYETSNFDIWHCDLYRLTHPDEVFELGLDEAFETSLCLIEWADRLGSETPENALQLSFEMLENDQDRKITFSGSSPQWDKIFDVV